MQITQGSPNQHCISSLICLSQLQLSSGCDMHNESMQRLDFFATPS